LSELILNNNALKSLEQSTVLSRAIGNAQLESFDIQYCSFENGLSFWQMLEGCSNNVKKLLVRRKHNKQCTVVADLLRNPATMLRYLGMTLKRGHITPLDELLTTHSITVTFVGF
jgi:hypothetical protein